METTYSQSNKTTLDSCIKLANNTLNTSIITNTELNLQGEQMKSTYDNAHLIDHNVTKANGILNRMLSYVGISRKQSYHKYQKVLTQERADQDTSYLQIYRTPEDDYDTLIHLADQLKEVNLDIGRTLTDQNELLGRLEDKIEENNIRLKSTNKRINKLL